MYIFFLSTSTSRIVKYRCHFLAPYHSCSWSLHQSSVLLNCYPGSMAGTHALCHHALVAPSSAGPNAASTRRVIAAQNKHCLPGLSCRSSPYLTAGRATRHSAHARLALTGRGHFHHSCRSKRGWRASSGGDSPQADEGGATVPVIFEGVYGPWTIEQSDKIEVREEGEEGERCGRRCGGGEEEGRDASKCWKGDSRHGHSIFWAISILR